MKILAIDSTESTVAAAIADGRELKASVTVNGRLNHSETLLPAIEEIMRETGLKYDDIDIFACSEGPGSFTGVRIGAATVKGLAFGRGKPCVGVSALHAMAYNFIGFHGVVCPVMDARRSQLYNALFSVNGSEIIRLTPDRVITADELAAELSGYSDTPIYFCGGGYNIARNACRENRNVADTPELMRYQNAFSVALCALDRYDGAEGEDFTDITLSPSYLRPSSAERNRNRDQTA